MKLDRPVGDILY